MATWTARRYSQEQYLELASISSNVQHDHRMQSSSAAYRLPQSSIQDLPTDSPSSVSVPVFLLMCLVFLALFVAFVAFLSFPPLIVGHAVLRATHHQAYSESLASSAEIAAFGTIYMFVELVLSGLAFGKHLWSEHDWSLTTFWAHQSSKMKWLLGLSVIPYHVVAHVLFVGVFGAMSFRHYFPDAAIGALSPGHAASAGALGVVLIDLGLAALALLIYLLAECSYGMYKWFSVA